MTKLEITPQVKICGITRVQDATRCAELGADAIGCVFYSKSPRRLTKDQARDICAATPDPVKTVGVFVNETFSSIMVYVEYCHLSAVQLHGKEPPELVRRLRRENIRVLKWIFERCANQGQAKLTPQIGRAHV